MLAQHFPPNISKLEDCDNFFFLKNNKGLRGKVLSGLVSCKSIWLSLFISYLDFSSSRICKSASDLKGYCIFPNWSASVDFFYLFSAGDRTQGLFTSSNALPVICTLTWHFNHLCFPKKVNSGGNNLSSTWFLESFL